MLKVFFQNSAFFFNKRSCHSKMNNSEPLEIILIHICMSFDVLLGKMYVVRSDDNNMAMSTVSSYGETDYNRQFVLTAFPFQMPKNCCVPHCTKKVYVEEGKKISFHRFPKEKNLLDLINKNMSVCSRHFKP